MEAGGGRWAARWGTRSSRHIPARCAEGKSDLWMALGGPTLPRCRAHGAFSHPPASFIRATRAACPPLPSHEAFRKLCNRSGARFPHWPVGLQYYLSHGRAGRISETLYYEHSTLPVVVVVCSSWVLPEGGSLHTW